MQGISGIRVQQTTNQYTIHVYKALVSYPDPIKIAAYIGSEEDWTTLHPHQDPLLVMKPQYKITSPLRGTFT